MNSVSFWENMWQQVEIWRLIMAFVLGGVIGCVYFKSLQWSINKLSETKHKIRMFAGVALFRIVLFFCYFIFHISSFFFFVFYFEICQKK